MGRPIVRNLENEMMTKVKKLFDKILEKVNKDHPTHTFEFEQFVDCLDENDPFTKRVFEYLIKEIAQRYRATHPNSQHPARPRPHTIHHTLVQESGGSNEDNNSSTSTTSGPHRHHHHHPHPQHTPHVSHAHSAPERDSIPRSPSGPGDSPVPSDGPVANNSSGSSISYLFSNQVGNRRARIAQRMLSHDLFAYNQGQPSLLSTISAISNSSGSGQNRTLSAAEDTNSSDSINIVETEISSSPMSSGSLPSTTEDSPNTRRLSRIVESLERQRAFIYRPRPRSAPTASSMENAPDSFGTETTDQSRESRYLDHVERTRQRHDYIRQYYLRSLRSAQREQSSQPSQQHQQQLNGLRQIERTNHQHLQALLALQGQRLIASDDTQDQTQRNRQPQPRYQLRENGLMLVQPTSISNITSENATIGDSLLSTSNVETSLPSEDSYHEFRDSTQRSRAAMRNALAAELNIEEDHQVLLTGEVSRRRRRRVIGRFSNLGDSPDIASDNSSTIISQSQQQLQQQDYQIAQASRQGQPQIQVQEPTENSATPPPNSATHSITELSNDAGETPEVTSNDSGSVENSYSTIPSSEGSSIVTESAVPNIAVQLIDSNPTSIEDSTSHSESRNNNDRLGSELNIENEDQSQDNNNQHRNVPPTPPSPNPNMNPMPTFQDRRRSSINPADIEAVVREMRANARSSVARLGTISSPPSTSLEDDTDQTMSELEVAQVQPSESSLSLSSRQIGQGNLESSQLTPSAPTPLRSEPSPNGGTQPEESLLGIPPLH
ncbi:hypothetical protein BGZ46_009418 [Entomortierella lignicola]|nr:hypothetical protein BGZ46_009418 [Entomortierella lignicola]